jgi:hypothetical protein
VGDKPTISLQKLWDVDRADLERPGSAGAGPRVSL